MSKNKKMSIEFDYEGEHYKLEYTVSSLKQMEKMGVKFAKLDDKILTSTETLFSGLFIANHVRTPEKKRLEIFREFKEVSGDDNLNDIISEMLAEAIEEMGSHKGNLEWSVNRG